jgi:hypothetical protein
VLICVQVCKVGLGAADIGDYGRVLAVLAYLRS